MATGPFYIGARLRPPYLASDLAASAERSSAMAGGSMGRSLPGALTRRQAAAIGAGPVIGASLPRRGTAPILPATCPSTAWTGPATLASSQSSESPRDGAAPSLPTPLPGNPASQPSPQLYFERLVKLAPSEVVVLYLGLRETTASFTGIWATICLALVLLSRSLGTKGPRRSIQMGSVAIAAISFILWVYAMGGYFLTFKLPATPGVISAAIAVWTFVVPLIYKGDGPSDVGPNQRP